MIEISNLKRVEEGVSCNVCHHKTRVKELKFKADDAPGGSCVFLCDHCRDDLASELEIVRFYEGCK